MKIASIQMVSGCSLEQNLAVATKFVQEAAQAGSVLVVLPEYFCLLGKADEARVKQAYSDFSTIEGQLKLYRLDNYRYPTTEQGLQALVEKPSIDPVPRQWQNGGYLDALPIDPWGNAYLYSTPGEKGDYDIYTYGADGVAGGIEQDKDIYSWERFEANK
jgi:general secretion pathway protein G